jgi:rhodanese-related sulfurtransferase
MAGRKNIIKRYPMKKAILFAVFSLFIAFQSCKEEKSSIAKVISAQEVYDAVYNSDGNHQLVDVRTEEEFGVSHLKDAQNICVTMDNFKERAKGLDKNKPVYVYCKSGGRSAKAAKILTDMGFTKVYDLQGGITNWEDKGLETTD